MEGDFLCQPLLHIAKQCLRHDGICRARERQPDRPAARRRERPRDEIVRKSVHHELLRYRHAERGAKKTVGVLSVIHLAASAVIALGYSVFYCEISLPSGSVGQLLDLMDYVSNSVMMPFIALLSALLIGWVKSPDYVIEEVESSGAAFRRKRLYAVMVRFVVPVMMLILFLQSTGIMA